MYFWKVDRLKAELRDAPLPAHQVLAYILAFVALWSVTLAPTNMPAQADLPSLTPLSWALGAANAIGLYLAYRANGGREGPDFAARLLALMWIVSMRLMVFLGVAGIVFLLAFFGWSARSTVDAVPAPANVVKIVVGFTALVQLLFYWRLVHHMATIGKAQPAANPGA